MKKVSVSVLLLAILIAFIIGMIADKWFIEAIKD